MCLPIKFLQSWLSVTAIVTMVGGVICLVYGSVMYSEMSSDSLTSVEQLLQDISIGLIVLGVVVMVVCCIGLLGIYKKQGCCITIYNILNTILALLMIILALLAIIFLKKYDPMLNDQLHCLNNNTTFQKLNRDVKKVGEFFCSNKCPCDTNNMSYPPTVWNPLKNKSSSKGAHNVFQCPLYKQVLAMSNVNIPGLHPMYFLENHLNCAGFCAPVGWRSFTQISYNYQQRPACGPALYQFIKNKATSLEIFSVIMSLLLTFTSLFACCLCCHPQRRKKVDFDILLKNQGP